MIKKGIIIITSFIFLINSSYAQESSLLNKTFNITCKKCNIENIFKDIEKSFDIYFSYPSKFIDLKKPIKFQNSSIILKEALDSVSKYFNLSYSIVERQIIFKKSQILNFDSLTYIRLEIKILEENTNNPVIYAHVGVLRKPIITITNNDGYFSLTLPYNFINDTLVITCIGYKTTLIPIKEAMLKNSIYITPDVIPINEVIIRRRDPIYLLNKAIENIKQNYPSKDFIQTGFYRETIRKRNEIISLVEAVIKCLKSKYTDQDFISINDQVKIEKGRRITANNNKDTIALKLKGGLNTILQLDLIKNLPDFLDETKEMNYNYYLNDILFNGNDELYEIIFKQKDYIKRPLYYGKIYIDVKTLAIVKVIFSLSEKGIEKEWVRFVVRKPEWIKIKPQKAEYTVIYNRTNNKYYPFYVSSYIEMKIGDRKNIFHSTYSFQIESAFFEVDTSNIQSFPLREVVNTTNILEKIIDKYESSYWEKYNFIPPEQPLLDIINSYLSKSK